MLSFSGKPSRGQVPKALSPALGTQADHQSSCLQSNVTASLHHDIQHTGPMVFNPKSWEEAEDIEEDEEFNEHLLSLFPQPEINPTWLRKPSPTVLSPLSPTILFAPSPTALSTQSVPAKRPASSSLPFDASGGTDTYSPNKIRVLLCAPNMKLLKDCKVVLKDESCVALQNGKPSQDQVLKSLSPACGGRADHQSSCLQSNVTASPRQDIQPTGPMVFNLKSWEDAGDDEEDEEFDKYFFSLFSQPEINPTWLRKSLQLSYHPRLQLPTALSTQFVPAKRPASSSLPSDASDGTDTYSPNKIIVLARQT